MKLPGYDNLKPHTTLEWHIANVYRDKEFQSAAHELTENKGLRKRLAVIELANIYRLTTNEVDHFIRHMNGVFMSLPFGRRVWISRWDTQMDISFVATATRAEVMDVIDMYFKSRHSFDRLLGNPVPAPSKRKATENPGLIYAIFKQLNIAKLPFNEVFRLYTNGELPGYRGQTTQFPTMSKLEEYYDRFKPQPVEI